MMRKLLILECSRPSKVVFRSQSVTPTIDPHFSAKTIKRILTFFLRLLFLEALLMFPITLFFPSSTPPLVLPHSSPVPLSLSLFFCSDVTPAFTVHPEASAARGSAPLAPVQTLSLLAPEQVMRFPLRARAAIHHPIGPVARRGRHAPR